MVEAVAHAIENKPVNAINDGIRRHSNGKLTVKFPTDVKKLAVSITAVIQSLTKPDTISAAAQIPTERN